MANFIMNEAGSIRSTQFSPSIEYDIGEICFYVPQSISGQVFLVVRGENNLYEIVELTRAKGIQQGTNILYKLSLEQPLRIDKATATMYLLVINTQDGSYMISSQFKVKITCEKYKIARSVYLSQQVGQKVQYLYTQMLALTEENRKIADELKRGDTE